MYHPRQESGEYNDITGRLWMGVGLSGGVDASCWPLAVATTAEQREGQAEEHDERLETSSDHNAATASGSESATLLRRTTTSVRGGSGGGDQHAPLALALPTVETLLAQTTVGSDHSTAEQQQQLLQ